MGRTSNIDAVRDALRSIVVHSQSIRRWAIAEHGRIHNAQRAHYETRIKVNQLLAELEIILDRLESLR